MRVVGAIFPCFRSLLDRAARCALSPERKIHEQASRSQRPVPGSLGKGGKGTTPIRAVGSTDQHSQLQLYLDGPKDKLFHIITVKRAGTGHKLNAPNLPALDYLKGKTAGDLLQAEQKATLETLVRAGKPVRVLALDALNEETLGALIMHFTLEIILMAELLGLNAFDQPAVEQSKRLAREYLLAGNV